MKRSEIIEGKKLCCVCKEWLRVEVFNRCEKAHTKLQPACATCQSSSAKEMTIRKRRERKIKSLYNLSWETYTKMLEEQDGECKICTRDLSLDVSEGGETASVDHCHASGEVRGLLCGSCNRALGLISDSIENAERMVKYLGKHYN